MKLIKSTIKRDKPIGKLPRGKVRITMQGTNAENIWVAKDEENKVMYLLNNAIMFYPAPSWGMELPLRSSSIDLHKYIGDTTEEIQFTVCEETYNNLKDFLDEEGNFNIEDYIAFYSSGVREAQNT